MSETVLQAINDGPVDFVGFQYQTSILEGIPRSESGDVFVQQTVVHEGDRFFDSHHGQVRIYPGPDVTMDQMVVRFCLRSGINWSDETPLTAFDSEYAYQLLSESPLEVTEGWHPPTEVLLLKTASYRALDAHMTEWIGVPGLVSADYPKFFFAPMPRHLGVDLQTDWPRVGWGAFQIKEWIPGKHLLAVRNSHYFRADEGLPKVAEVEFRFLEPPYGNLPGKISDSGCDVVSVGAAYYTTVEEWLQAAQRGSIRFYTVPREVGLQLLFNLKEEDAAIRDPNVRQAIALCLNRAELAELVHGVMADSYVHPLDPAYTSVASYPFDPLQGRLLLKQAGWQATESLAPTLTLTLALRDSATMRLIADQIVTDLSACGITVQADYIVSEDFYLPWPEGSIHAGEYDLVVVSLGALEGPACDWFLTDNIPSASNPKGVNIAGFQDSEFDRLCKEARGALEEKEYKSLHREAQLRWGEALPALPLLWFTNFTGVACRVNGYAIDPTGIELWNIEEISLDGECNQ